MDSVSTQTVGQTTNTASQVLSTNVQTNIVNVRDLIQSSAFNQTTGRPLGFASGGLDDWDSNVLAYGEKGRVVTNPLARLSYGAAPLPILYSFWGLGSIDREHRSGSVAGFDIGRSTRTYGGIGGGDAIIRGVRTSSDALVLGFFVGDTQSRTTAHTGAISKVQGPSAGFYAAYVDGGLSADATIKGDFFDVDQSAPGGFARALGMNNYSYLMNFNNKIRLGGEWWIEETVGTSITRSVWNSSSKAQNFINGQEIRLQGGVRTGTSVKWNEITVEPTLTTLLYTPIEQHVASAVPIAGAPIVLSDQGRIFGQAIGKLNFVLASYLSSYVEGEVRGTSGVLAGAGRLGLRYTFH